MRIALLGHHYDAGANGTGINADDVGRGGNSGTITEPLPVLGDTHGGR